jgi:hypothetical protein
VKTILVLRLEDCRGQVPSRKTCQTPISSVSWLGIDLMRAGIPVSWFPSAVCCQDQRKCSDWSDWATLTHTMKTSRILLFSLYHQKQAAKWKATALTKGWVTWRSACRVREGYSEGIPGQSLCHKGMTSVNTWRKLFFSVEAESVGSFIWDIWRPWQCSFLKLFPEDYISASWGL